MFTLCLGAALLLGSRTALASALPVQLQADLIVKLAAYDKNMRTRADGQVRTLIVVKGGDSDSDRYGAQLAAGLGRVEKIAALPHSESVVTFKDAATVAATIKEKRIAIVVFAPELASQASAVKKALDDVDVLSFAPSSEAVKQGIVVGFELEEGKPKLFLNLPQAGRQHVAMSADVMKLMTVYQ